MLSVEWFKLQGLRRQRRGLSYALSACKLSQGLQYVTVEKKSTFPNRHNPAIAITITANHHLH